MKKLVLMLIASIMSALTMFALIKIFDNKPKEQLYHRVVEQDIVGPDTIENIYFVPDSVWYKTH